MREMEKTISERTTDEKCEREFITAVRIGKAKLVVVNLLTLASHNKQTAHLECVVGAPTALD